MVSVMMHSWEIEVNTVDKNYTLLSKFCYTVENPTQTVILARIGSYIAVKVDGYAV
ncbi:hypothetical protein L915_06224 [Phytophthora nicotianae]|uniref:Uncharacterized protein n=1 Tax=Phytophthora nicotianae TaxID=4792 RepID=W2H405_PHYNI|nr:hypothetical protein L915_06224 [Phytophthora nicotianae]